MTQQEYIGEGSIVSLTEVLDKLSVKNIFLVTGGNSFSSSGAETALRPLLRNYQVNSFSRFSENPKAEDLFQGITLFRKHQSDCIVAVGGGSVIDMAKLIRYYGNDQIDEVRLFEKIKNNEAVHQAPSIPLIAIPTTSGSGSEATHFAVVYIDKTKYSVASPAILPDTAIVDSALTFTSPPRRTAISGMDALSQAMESYWSIHSNVESQQHAAEAIRLVIGNLPEAVNRPTKESRLNMARAAHLAGKAINITKTTAPHAISYALTSYFGVPHGHAVALTLGELFLFNANVTESDIADPRGVAHVRTTMAELSAFLGCASPEESREALTHLLAGIGLETKLSELGIKTPADVATIVENVNLERLQNNPRKLAREGLQAILERIM